MYTVQKRRKIEDNPFAIYKKHYLISLFLIILLGILTVYQSIEALNLHQFTAAFLNTFFILIGSFSGLLYLLYLSKHPPRMKIAQQPQVNFPTVSSTPESPAPTGRKYMLMLPPSLQAAASSTHPPTLLYLPDMTALEYPWLFFLLWAVCVISDITAKVLSLVCRVRDIWKNFMASFG